MSILWKLDQALAGSEEMDEKKTGSATMSQYLLISLRYDLIREIATFCHSAPWHDTAKKNLSCQLPTLTMFLTSIRNAETWIIAGVVDAKPLIPLIAWLIASTKTSLFGKAHSRKNTVRHYIWARIASSLPANVYNDAEPKIKELVPIIRQQIIDARQEKPIETRAAILAVLAEISQMLHCGDGMHFTGVPFRDLAQQLAEETSTFVWDEDEHARSLADHEAFMKNMTDEERRSREMLGRIVVSDGNIVKRQDGVRVDSAMMGEVGENVGVGRRGMQRSWSSSCGDKETSVSPSSWMSRSLST